MLLLMKHDSYVRLSQITAILYNINCNCLWSVNGQNTQKLPMTVVHQTHCRISPVFMNLLHTYITLFCWRNVFQKDQILQRENTKST